MRISKRGQITIPKQLRDLLSLNQGAEFEILPTARGLLIQKQPEAQHTVERVDGLLDGICDVDRYLEEIRGR